ncbi:RNA polymerase sigma factor [Methylogaea oryzae]|nr:sigma-70 family RNA polymerase sigma factor [Methylogaea oryzae]
MTQVSTLTLAQLMDEHGNEVRRVLMRRLGCRETAADVLQESFHRLAASGLWREAVNPRALLYRIAGNLATDYERRRKVESRYIDPEPADDDTAAFGVTPEQIVESRERLDLLLAAIQQLPPQCQRVFLLRKFEDIGQQEIADRLGISRNMVEKHLRHALIVLRKGLGDM